MKLIRYPQLKPLPGGSCVTVGNFDGLHLGHQALIQQTIEQARTTDTQSVVVSMQPLPIQFFQGAGAVELLTRFRQKYHLLCSLGVDVWCLLNFNHQLAAMTAEQFVTGILFDGLNAQSIVIGDDFKFGANRGGDFKLLQSMAATAGVNVVQQGSITVNGIRVSSTAIRAALKAGFFERVKHMLGRDFSVLGKVESGRRMGQQLGYPTLNIELRNGAFPLHGVYVVRVVIDQVAYQAVASVGYNPSVGGNAKRLEGHVLNFNQQVYGKTVEVLFYKKLRNEVEFDTLTALKTAIATDVRETQAYFAREKGESV